MSLRACAGCASNLPVGAMLHRKWCSPRCKVAHRRKHGGGTIADGHDCRVCGARFPLGPRQANKWLCSAACRRAQNAKSVRSFHERRPLVQEIYRARTKAKLPPDSQNRRFYRLNPDAPRACEACGESRVTEIAHKPGHERMGARRTSANLQWPLMVWVLCPTCHRLLDRMHYAPSDLGLAEAKP